MSGGTFSEVHHSVALPWPHSKYIDRSSSLILSILWNLTVLLLSYSRTLLLSWMISLSITFCYTQDFRGLDTSGNTAAKYADNEVGSTVSRYSSTLLQYVKGMPHSSFLHHEQIDAYKAYIFFGVVTSPPPVGNNSVCFLLLYFFYLSMSVSIPFSVISVGGFPERQCQPDIWRWWITDVFSTTVISLLPLSSVIFLSLVLRLVMKLVVPLMFWFIH